MLIFRPEQFAQGIFILGVMGMRCPFCVDEMEHGYIQGGNILVWVRKKHHISLEPREGEVQLDRNYVTNCAVPAWICKHCEKVIIDYSDNVKGE